MDTIPLTSLNRLLLSTFLKNCTFCHNSRDKKGTFTFEEYQQIKNENVEIINDDSTYPFISYLSDLLAKSKPCNGVQREHNKKLNNGLPILHKVPPKRDYGRYFCIMAEKGGTSHGGLTEKLSLFFHAKKQEVNAYGR